MPAPPEPKWSQPLNGLRLGLSFDPEKFSLGEQVAAQLRFENMTDEPIAFYHQAGDAVKRFAISNDSGQTLKMESAGARRPRRRREESSPIQTIAPGKAFETQI